MKHHMNHGYPYKTRWNAEVWLTDGQKDGQLAMKVEIVDYLEKANTVDCRAGGKHQVLSPAVRGLLLIPIFILWIGLSGWFETSKSPETQFQSRSK